MRALLLAVMLVVSGLGQAEEGGLSTGQTLYLPIYSHLLYGNKAVAGKPGLYPLSALVSLRNIDPRQPIRLLSARYFDTDGKLLREYLSASRVLPPLGTLELFVERNDLSGGSGANCVITWQSDKPANPPVVEAVHADVTGNRTLSFITTARPIR
ncbi:MAG: DUF3124 domain-containing protein [Thiobacillus sp.]|nr:DUF3124 domain-containing protein [Thiobacillus sp.]